MVVFKGVIHLHSTYSHDASLSLGELKELLKPRGYHFVLMAEHQEDMAGGKYADYLVKCADLSDSEFLLIPGIEFHTLDLGICGLTSPGELPAEEAERLAVCLAERTFNVLVHPRGERFFPSSEILEKLHAVEVWNVKADGGRYPAMRRIRTWKTLKRLHDVLPIFSLDLHDETQCADVHVRVDIPELTVDAVISVMIAGRYRLHRGDREWSVDRLSRGLRIRMLLNSLMRKTTKTCRNVLGWALPRTFRTRLRVFLDGVRNE